MKNSTFATMTAMVVLTPLMISTPSYAGMVSDSTAAHLLSQCFVAEDARDSTIPGTVGCCSFSLSYCIECPPAGTSGKCEKIVIRRMPKDKLRPNAAEAGKLAPVERPTMPSNLFLDRGFRIFESKPVVE